MTERQIQCALFREFRSTSKLVVPNYTPVDWWQCDLWRVTAAGYAEEYEIKLTRSDFRADASKCQKSKLIERLPGGTKRLIEVETHKHAMVSQGRGPSRFYYIAPEGLLDDDSDIPSWAGFREVNQDRQWLRVRTVRRAPELHRRPVDHETLAHAKSVFYWRFWGERAKNIELRRKLLDTNM